MSEGKEKLPSPLENSASSGHSKDIRVALLAWYDEVKRALPWRAGVEPDHGGRADTSSEIDPYAVWVSEIMLQQTKVATALPYYERWMQRFPTVQALSQAPQEDVLSLWQGLGYYARARNLHRAAIQVVEEHGGGLPQSYSEWLKLPGVGTYTAGAIASITLGEEVPAVDGNARRVMSRLHALLGDPSRGECARLIQNHATQLAKGERPGDLNQSLMELGASLCSPRNPNCDACPLKAYCRAFAEGRQASLPTPTQRARPRISHGIACRIQDLDGQCLMFRRPAHGLLGGLWEYPIWIWPESDAQLPQIKMEADDIAGLLRRVGWDIALDPEQIELYDLGQIRHEFSHIDLRLRCWEIRLERLPTNTELQRFEPTVASPVPHSRSMDEIRERRSSYGNDSISDFDPRLELRPAAEYEALRIVSLGSSASDELPVSKLMQKIMRLPAKSPQSD